MLKIDFRAVEVVFCLINVVSGSACYKKNESYMKWHFVTAEILLEQLLSV